MATYDSGNPNLRKRLVNELRRWAESHPQRGEVVVASMVTYDERERGAAEAEMFDPYDFVVQVAERTPFGESFVEFVVEQANRYDVEPEEFVQRAVRANEGE